MTPAEKRANRERRERLNPEKREARLAADRARSRQWYSNGGRTVKAEKYRTRKETNAKS